MNNIQKTLDHAQQRCHDNGTLLTTKRKQLLSSLLCSGKALSAYELVDLCKLNFDISIQAMSVYRILHFLQSEGLAHKLSVANKYVACVHITCNHAHAVSQFLICTSCKQVKGITLSKLVIDAVIHSSTQAGFHSLNPEIEMKGICSSCT